MSIAHHEPLMAPSCFYGTARIITFLRRVTKRLRPAKIKSRLKPLLRRVTEDVLEPQLRKAMDRRSPTAQQPRVAAIECSGVPAQVELSRSIHSFADCAAIKHVSWFSMARCDHQLLQRDNYLQPAATNVAALQRVINVCDGFIGALSRVSHSKPSLLCDPQPDEPLFADHSMDASFKCETFLANLQHLLLWLRQSALDAIVQYFSRMTEVALLNVYASWLWQNSQNWFSEWPDGQRPLSTTWPWNIKPSLVVLWGVCWMFYDHEVRLSGSRSGAPARQVRQDFWVRPQAANEQTIEHSDTVADTVAGTSAYANYSWLHPYQAGPSARRASQVGNAGSSVPPAVPATSASTYSYINASASETPSLFSGTPFDVWPYSSGIQTQQQPPLDDPIGFWQSQGNQPAEIQNAFPPVNQSSALMSHGAAQPPQTRSTRAASGGNPPNTLPFGTGVQTTRRNMQDYPSPQLSDISPQIDLAYPFAPATTMASPAAQSVIRSPSITASSSSPRTDREPRRNIDGTYTCDHRNCPEGNPAFARKCEWSKHMDKHTRPYICEERGCENIRGFTYPGGLNRHQREVHRQHGGPRAACHCPHKDCKRSTGVGFTRKENLAEHIRRSHRDGVGNIPGGSQQSESARQQLAGGSRKRRRMTTANDSDNEDVTSSQNSQNLKQEVKKLRKELKEKDERLRRLEEQVSMLATSHPTRIA